VGGDYVEVNFNAVQQVQLLFELVVAGFEFSLKGHVLAVQRGF
jgi:hypothetical protein